MDMANTYAIELMKQNIEELENKKQPHQEAIERYERLIAEELEKMEGVNAKIKELKKSITILESPNIINYQETEVEEDKPLGETHQYPIFKFWFNGRSVLEIAAVAGTSSRINKLYLLKGSRISTASSTYPYFGGGNRERKVRLRERYAHVIDEDKGIITENIRLSSLMEVCELTEVSASNYDVWRNGQQLTLKEFLNNQNDYWHIGHKPTKTTCVEELVDADSVENNSDTVHTSTNYISIYKQSTDDLLTEKIYISRYNYFIGAHLGDNGYVILDDSSYIHQADSINDEWLSDEDRELVDDIHKELIQLNAIGNAAAQRGRHKFVKSVVFRTKEEAVLYCLKEKMNDADEKVGYYA